MKVSQAGERYIVIDDFLDGETLQAIREHSSQLEYRPLNSPVDPSTDGVAFRSRGGMVQIDRDLSKDALGRALHAVMLAIVAHPEIYGVANDDWALMSFDFMQYPAGSRLSWHGDAETNRTGAYTLYLHDEWRPSWGGELAILDDRVTLGEERINDISAVIEDAVANASVMLTAIHPRPNRLVMMRAGTCHYISRVDKSAGSAKRCSLNGFISRRTARLSALTHLLGLRDGDVFTRTAGREHLM